MATAARGQDVIGFTRIFVLFCTLVLVPALFLSGFGVIAILNERQAEKQRRYEDALEVLAKAQRAFAEIVDGADRAALTALMSSPAAASLDVHPIASWLVLSREGDVVDGAGALIEDPDVVARLARLTARAEVGHTSHAFVDEGGFVGVVSMQRGSDGRAVVYALDDEKLDQQLRARFAGPLKARVRTAGGGEEPVQGAVDRLMEIVRRGDDDAIAEDEPAELATRALDAPFERYTLVVETREPVIHITLIAYIVLLVVFLATLVTGVVITARLIWLETRLSRLKTDFVSHMSHELRTPLTSIRMFIETLKMGRTSADETEECLQLLAKETERLSEMIERVLGYARLRAGRRLFTPADVPVKLLIDEALDAFKAQRLLSGSPTEDLVLATDVPADVPTIHTDREAFVEALLNLVSNAYKYSGPQKEITVFARAGRRGRVLVGVRDNGPGLPKAEHKRVFERFYQARSLLSSTTRAGSGLGLAITRAIVEGNGGRIHVESEPGKGATFVMEMRHGAA